MTDEFYYFKQLMRSGMFRLEAKLLRSVSVELLKANHKSVLSLFTYHRKQTHGCITLSQCRVLSRFLDKNYNSLFPRGRKMPKMEYCINQICKISSILNG